MNSTNKRRRITKDDDDERTCPICLESLDGSRTIIGCNHADGQRHEFHRDCMTRLFSTDTRNRCPVCRRPCIGMRAELVTHHMSKGAYKVAFDLLVGGVTGVLTPAQQSRAIAVLGTSLGFPEKSVTPNDNRFSIVIALVIHSLRRRGALKFLVVVMEVFGLEIDEWATSLAKGTPIKWFVSSPHLAVISSRERIRAIRVLLALGASPEEASVRSGSKQIDLALAVASDVRQAVLNLRYGGIDETSLDHIANIAFDHAK